MKLRKIAMIICSAALVFSLAACGKKDSGESKGSEEKSKQLKIVTTFYPMYDFTKNVAGDNATIDMLIGSGTEPHDYEPSAKDIAKIQDADVFIYNSDDMETWVSSALKSIDTKKVKVIEAASGIELLEGSEEEEHDHDHEEEEEEGHTHEHDPHVWLDPVLAQTEVDNICKGLVATDKENEETYKANAQSYKDKLAALDEKFVAGFKDAKNRTFVTQHAAFAYLALRYDLTQESISGISPDQEPTAAELAQVEDFVKKNKVTVIFTEEIASPKIAKTVADATGASLEVLSPLEGITEEDQDKGLDYIGVMEKNLTALQKVIK